MDMHECTHILPLSQCATPLPRSPCRCYVLPTVCIGLLVLWRRRRRPFTLRLVNKRLLPRVTVLLMLVLLAAALLVLPLLLLLHMWALRP